MVKLNRLVKDYREAGALNTLLGLYGFVDEHTFLCKDGSLAVALKVQGVDYECLDHEQLDGVARRFEATLRVLSDRFRIYQYLLKRDHAPLPHQDHENPIVHRAIRNRIDYLRDRAASLYTFDVYFVITYEGWHHTKSWRQQLDHALTQPRAAWKEYFSTAGSLNVLDEELNRAREVLANKVNSLLVQLDDTLEVKLLDKQQAFQFLRRLVNFTPWKSDSVALKYDTHLDYFVCDSHLECHRDHLRIDEHHLQVLTVKEPPAQTWPNLLHDLQEIPSNCIIVTEWQRVDNFVSRKEINRKRRHFFNSKASMTNYIGNQAPQPQEMLIDDGAQAHVRDLGECITELEVNGNYFGQWSMTVVLYDQNRQRLQRSVAEAFKVFSTHDAVLTEERYNLLNSFLAIMPGNQHYNLRRLWLLSTNYADLSFLFTLHTGEARNGHLGTEYLAVLETNHSAPYFLNLHYQDTAHTLIFGRTGSGKSFFLNFLLTHLQKYQPFTFIFDLGNSYESLTRLFGGGYLKLGLEQRSFTINPFSLPPTRENLHFLFSFVKVLIESGGEKMTHQDERDLFEQVENLYEIEPHLRRLYTLSNILNRTNRERMHRWVEGGQYEQLFDNAEDNLTFARFQTFEFEGMDKYPQVLEPLLFYVLHRANASIYDQQEATTFKAFVIDEAWRFFKNATIKAYIVEAVKTWRKRNAAMILATQSSADLLESELLDVLVESCATKLFLHNPDMNPETYRRVFHLNHTEAKLIAQLVPKQQVLVKRPDLAKVVNLNVDRVGYWLYTNSPYDNHRKREAFERYGFEQGLEVLARS